MSNNDTKDQVTLDDLDYFWTSSGVPCFMANRPDIEEIVEGFGFSIYYLICNIAEDKKTESKVWTNGKYETTNSITTDLTTGIVKVVNNFVGRSVTQVTDEDIYNFAPIRETALYNLPAIPRIIVDKLDEFFRLVDAQHGTESIVILTFDPTKNDSSGWGVLVPEQTNTSVHCKYEADSIVAQKPEHVMIVGSVHSHPNMAAYASGTDHADQADFDGIHITYGWQKSVNNGATQYHIEMQMNGSHWTLKPEDVFEDFIISKDPDPEVVEWTKNVKKVLPPQGGSAIPVAQQASSQPRPQGTHQQQAYTPRGTTKGDPRYQEYPDPKDPKPHLVIAEMDFADEIKSDCPSCGYDLSINDMLEYNCPICDMMLCDIKMSYNEILSEASKYLRARNKKTNINYYLWVKDSNNQDLLMRIADADLDVEEDNDSYTSLIQDPKPTVEEIPLDEYFYEGFSEDRTACCNLPLDQITDCNCAKTVYYEDLLKFDQDHPYDLYDQRGACSSCEFYYSRSCVPYYSALMNYAMYGHNVENKIEECKDYLPFSTESGSYSYHYY
jgi:hypothetical protein